MNRKKAASPASPKVYRSIREVSAELEVKPHVLRYWETQFPTLRPKKNRAGNRIYRPEEVVLLTRIKELLYAQRFTIEGAKRTLLEEKRPRVSAKTAKTGKAATSVVAEPTATPVVDHAERDRLAAELAQAHAERERLLTEISVQRGARADAESELASVQAELSNTRSDLAAAESEAIAVRADLESARADLAVSVDREKTRAAAMAVLRQELLLLTRELRGDGDTSTLAAAPRVTVKADDGSSASQPSVIEQEEQEEPTFPVGAVPISVGA